MVNNKQINIKDEKYYHISGNYGTIAVSYTHLDVYKRQISNS